MPDPASNPPPFPLAATLEALDAILIRGERAELQVRKVLRAHPELQAAGRAEVARRIFGPACLRLRLGHLLEQARVARSSRALLAAYLLDAERLGPPEVADLTALSDAEIERLQLPPHWPTSPVERLSAERSLPPWLARLWIEQLGFAEADRLAASCNAPGPITVRANRLLGTREALKERLEREGIASRPTRFAPDGLQLLGRPNVFGCAAWRAGGFEVQDEGSQIVAQLLAARPGQKIVDFCAGSGGKTLAFAADLSDRGELVATDVSGARLIDLKARLRRAGVTCARAVEIPPLGPPPECALEADGVFVDAPCSSLGTLRRGPDARFRIDEEHVNGLPALQLSILDRAAACVRRGGTLVYATCTLNARENEAVAEAFSLAHPRFEPVEAAARLGDVPADELGAGRSLTLFPHRHGTDGFFAALWTRAR